MLFARVASDFPKLGEAGYPDSFMLYDADQFRQTGVIYSDPAVPPYPPAIYGPLFYMLLSIPGRIIQTGNPFLGPRVVILLAFVACVAATASITRALIPVRSARVWGMLFASSIGTMPDWVLQLRSDFPAAAFSLLSIRLLLGSGRWGATLAGAAAGISFQFKITFVAALAAGGLWLLAQRRWRDFVRFAAAAALFGLGPFLYLQLREPQTIGRVLSMNLAIREYRGLAFFAEQSIEEPVWLLAVAALPLVIGKLRPRWSLLLLFATMSFAVALVAGSHAGANRNYFFEGLFAVTPLAVLGAMRIVDGRRRWGTTGGLLAAGLLTAYRTLPDFVHARSVFINEVNAATWLAERRPIEMLRLALPGHRVLSTVPRVSILTDEPVIVEPFFMAYSQLLGKFDTAPLRERIRKHEFEAVVTSVGQGHYRGVPSAPPDVMSEISNSYLPFCTAGQKFVVHLPRGQPETSALGARLRELGCTPRDTTRLPGW